MTLPYETVFEVGYLRNGAWVAALFMLILGLFVTLALWVNAYRMDRGNRRLALLFWSVPWLGVSVWLLFSTFSTAARYRTALDTGTCPVVEGTVEVTSASRKTDVIRVGEVEFRVRNSLLGMTYRWNAAAGGELTAGARVRVFYIDGQIIRLDVVR